MGNFKVIDTSNYALETVADVLLAEGFETKEEAQAVANQHNEGRGEGSCRWAIVVPAEQRLSRGMADII
jgi:uncharacterized protein YccT (UPF0319 family)